MGQRLGDSTRRLIAPTLYLLVSLAFTWPLALHAATSVIGPFHGDNLEYVWKLWWVRHAWFEQHVSPWLVPNVYYPYGYPLWYGEITPLHTVVMLPINWLLGEVWTYNLAIVLSTWLSGWFTYLWLMHLTDGCEGDSFVGGLIVAFCPYRMARIAGHLPLVSTEGIPLVLWGMERFYERRKWGDSLMIAAGITISALSSWYYALALGCLVPVYWLVRARPWRNWIADPRFWLGTGLSLLVTLGAVGPFLPPYLELAQAGQARVPLEEADFWSASLLDYSLPNWRHPLWEASVRRLFQSNGQSLPYEFLLSFGYVGGTLALFGWRRGHHSAKRAVVVWTLVALVLSFGPSFHLLPGWALKLPLPATWIDTLSSALTWLGTHSLAREPFSLSTEGSMAIPLPALLVRWFVPAAVGMRSWTRFAFFATMGIAALAAWGLGVVERATESRNKTIWRRRLPAAVASLLVLFEFYAGPQALVPVKPRPVDEWMAQQPGDFTIVQMPLDAALSGPQMFYTRFHGKNIISGYGTYFPLLFEEWYPELADFPNEASIERLTHWPVRYVLVDRADLSDRPSLADAIAHQARLSLVTTVGGIDVYAISADE
jgi:hypothetical protein